MGNCTSKRTMREGRTRITKFTQLSRGDHIKMMRWKGITYWHHAIIKQVNSDDELVVIHFAPPNDNSSRSKGLIQEQTIDLSYVNNMSGKCLYRVDYASHAECHDPDEVVRRAEEIVDIYTAYSNNNKNNNNNSNNNNTQHEEQEMTTYTVDEYNLVFNNCEHFARWCKVGIVQCNQLRAMAQKGLKCGGDAGTKGLAVFLFLPRLLTRIGANVIDETVTLAVIEINHMISKYVNITSN